jgi:predicted TIM-barrel fold metal-dependent hydrolase
MDVAALLRPWNDIIHEQIPGLELFDAHTHLGENDPDGMRQSPDELAEILDVSRSRGCFVFPMHEPEGYRAANDMVIAAAEADDRLIPFCRINPRRDDGIPEAERALAAGARGIKLHPRAEEFALDHPDIRRLGAIADERTLPILIHAGRGIPALGEHVVALASEFPNARVILAHAGITDLSWIWRAAADIPNLLFDTSWWMPADLIALFSLVPPGQILFASDAPYGHTMFSAISQLRIALQAGLSPEQIRLIAAEQSLNIAAGRPLATAGPAVGEREQPPHLLLDRLAAFLQIGTIMTFRGGDGSEMLALARLAAVVPGEIDDAPVFAATRRLLDAFEEATAAAPDNRRRLAFLMLAITAASTPDVPVPAP